MEFLNLPNIELANIISIVAILISAFSAFYVSRMRRFEIKNLYRREILEWFENTVEILLKLERKKSEPDLKEKEELLSSLSKQIEIGRFFFPNIRTKKSTNENIPIAYQGERHLTLDCLVIIHDIHKYSKEQKYLHYIIILRRHFTSELFHMLDPKKYLQQSVKHRLSKGVNKTKLIDVIGISALEFSENLRSKETSD